MCMCMCVLWRSGGEQMDREEWLFQSILEEPDLGLLDTLK